MYGGGSTAARRISVGESSDEWLILATTVGTVEMVSWEREEEWIGCIVGGVGANWGCGRRIVEVYKWFSE